MSGHSLQIIHIINQYLQPTPRFNHQLAIPDSALNALHTLKENLFRYPFRQKELIGETLLDFEEQLNEENQNHLNNSQYTALHSLCSQLAACLGYQYKMNNPEANTLFLNHIRQEVERFSRRRTRVRHHHTIRPRQ